MAKNAIVVRQRSIDYETRDLDVYELSYYHDNPRINYIISGYAPEDVTDELIEGALLALESTKDLKQDIERNGGLLEPIIVSDNVVLEGNTRLCVYRRLHKQTSDPQWGRIKCHVLGEPLDEVEKFALLSNYHIKGKKAWDAYEKAACAVRMLLDGQGCGFLDLDSVATEIGSTPTKVWRMVLAYGAMRKHYLPRVTTGAGTPADSRRELEKYSYFEAMYQNKALRDRAQQTPGFLDEFAGWVAEGRIPKAQDVRELHNILDNKKARREFVDGDANTAYEEAIQTLYWQRPDKVDGFYKKVNRFRELIDGCPVSKIKAEVADNPQRKNVIRRCLKVFQKFSKEIEIE